MGRGYDSFWTQWTVGTAEYSDLPMPQPPDEGIYFEFFKARHTAQYLESYLNIQIFAGETLCDRIKLGVEVQSTQRDGKRWIFSTKERLTGIEQKY
jgi:dimethylaniline monooxygenase (N-oxide forming)